MKVAVVIPNLHSPVLDQTLAGLEAQTWPRAAMEAVVVGLDRYGYGTRYPWVRLIDTGRPVGPAVARNLGIRATDGEVVVFLDADGVPHPEWLARLARWFEDPAVGVVGGGVTFDWDGPYWSVCENVSTFHPVVTTAAAGDRPNLPTLNLAIRRAALDDVGVFDERYPKAAGEDTDLTVRLRQAGYRLHFDPTAVVEHRPPRTTLAAILRKAADIGYYSLKVDPRYRASEGLPGPLWHPMVLRMLSPLVAAGVTVGIFRRQPGLRRRGCWVGVYLAKLAWCWGAARRLAENRGGGIRRA